MKSQGCKKEVGSQGLPYKRPENHRFFWALEFCNQLYGLDISRETTGAIINNNQNLS